MKPTSTAHLDAGPKWVGFYDDLKLPGGTTIGQTDNETLRKLLDRVAHTRRIDYAAMLKRVHDDAGSKAVNEWLAERR